MPRQDKSDGAAYGVLWCGVRPIDKVPIATMGDGCDRPLPPYMVAKFGERKQRNAVSQARLFAVWKFGD